MFRVATAVPSSARGQLRRPRNPESRSTASYDNPVTSAVVTAIIADVDEVEVVVAHSERATLRVGDVFLKIDADQTRTDVEVEAMAMAPIPTRRSCGGSRPYSRSPPSKGRHSAASASR